MVVPNASFATNHFAAHQLQQQEQQQQQQNASLTAQKDHPVAENVRLDERLKAVTKDKEQLEATVRERGR